MIAFDLTDGPQRGAVVYLCHDEGCDIHGKTLGIDFEDFITKWSRIGCVGPEGSWFELFSANDEIQPNGELAVAWRAWLDDPDA